MALDGADDEPPPKRRKPASSRRRKASDVSTDEHGAAAGAGPSGGAAAAAAGAEPSGAEPGKKAPRKKAAKEPVEQRVDDYGNKVTYRPKASLEVLTRIARAMPGSAHRMFLVDSRPLGGAGEAGGPAAEYHVLGATGNVYTVRISRQPRCICPDFGKGHLCKHILFVMLRVLHQRQDNPLIWQKALLTSEVEQLLAGAGAGAAGAPGDVDGVLASEAVRRRYAALAAGQAAGAAAGGSVQRPIEGECPICYEALAPGGGAAAGGEAITFCGTCGNNMHKQCFGHWAATKGRSGQPVTCVYCRAPWKEEGGAAGGKGGGGAGGQSEYVNLSQYSDAHRTSPSLDQLYGSSAVWIQANQGQLGRRQAARLYAASQGWV